MILIMWGLFLTLSIGLLACQAQPEKPPAVEDTAILETAALDPSVIETPGSQPVQPTSADSQTIPAIPTAPPVEPTPEPAVIEAAWKSSAHADTFIIDAAGQNNSCARCHAPINWMPSMETLPESCFACKFELEDPPPFIPEEDWTQIPCKVCHGVDKKERIQPEIAWLEIPQLGEYINVASSTELCLKCHAPTDVSQHGDIQLGGAHADYQCVGCHSAHDLATSCDAVNCHSDVIKNTTQIPGHDEEHQVVSCVACHDGSGMEVGPDEEQAFWTTFANESANGSMERFAFTSHNIVLESSCDRCHFVDNPWALSANVEEP